MAQEVKIVNLTVNNGGTSEKFSTSTTSAQSAIYDNQSLLFITDAACYIRAGANPTALATGVDQYIPANQYVRIAPWVPGNRLAVIALTGTGVAYVTPGV